MRKCTSTEKDCTVYMFKFEVWCHLLCWNDEEPHRVLVEAGLTSLFEHYYCSCVFNHNNNSNTHSSSGNNNNVVIVVSFISVSWVKLSQVSEEKHILRFGLYLTILRPHIIPKRAFFIGKCVWALIYNLGVLGALTTHRCLGITFILNWQNRSKDMSFLQLCHI